MDNSEMIGAIIGGVAGYIISMIIVSPRFSHIGGGWYTQEGGMGFFKGCLVGLAFAVVGAIIGMLIAAR
jgi:hypothetical protein